MDANNINDWSKWSMFLIEGMRSLQGSIGELYEMIHDMDKTSLEVNQKLSKEFASELRKFQLEMQTQIVNINMELSKIQTKMAFWSALFGFLGTLVGGTLAYIFKDWVFKTGKP